MPDKDLQDWMKRRDEARSRDNERELFDPEGNLRRDVTMTLDAKIPTALQAIVKDAVNKAFVQLRANCNGGNINPSSGRCHLISSILVNILKLNNTIDAELVHTHDPIDLGDEYASGHSYIKIRLKGGNWFLVDPMYIQFVSENDRAGLPDVMIIPMDEAVDVGRSLFAHKITSVLHYVWKR